MQENWLSLTSTPVFATQPFALRTGRIAEAGGDGVNIAIEEVGSAAGIRSCLELVTRALLSARSACRIRIWGTLFPLGSSRCTSTLGIEAASRGSGLMQTPHRWRKSTLGWIR